eukprot:TRINITY_DN302_c0_g1_i1.p1 TRINITY_DN302_c0_g1~~TRINITY_DN302_c0_g1_i1.p1  ORF type:complete len:232 (-),score=31.36 TRINITY_DN302_c0_g1_i1:37-651(-)
MTTPSVIPNGHKCYLDRQLNYMRPYCSGSRFNCIINQVSNGIDERFKGTCNSTFKKGPYCTFGNVAYALGTKGILGNSQCVTCGCVKGLTGGGKNGAACTCPPLPPCFVDIDGRFIGTCPSNGQCIITKIGGGGLDNMGRPIDQGVCTFGEPELCAASGAGWGPKFYANNIKGMPKPGNRCLSCTCSKGGIPIKCQKKAYCRKM